jgi:hypothetical protein
VTYATHRPLEQQHHDLTSYSRKITPSWLPPPELKPSAIRPMAQVYGIEPVHQLIGDILAQDIIEARGQLGGHRHARLHGRRSGQLEDTVRAKA